MKSPFKPVQTVLGEAWGTTVMREARERTERFLARQRARQRIVELPTIEITAPPPNPYVYVGPNTVALPAQLREVHHVERPAPTIHDECWKHGKPLVPGPYGLYCAVRIRGKRWCPYWRQPRPAAQYEARAGNAHIPG